MSNGVPTLPALQDAQSHPVTSVPKTRVLPSVCPQLPSFIESVLLCSGHFLASVKVNINLLSFLCSVLFNFYLSLTNFYTLYSYQAH